MHPTKQPVIAAIVAMSENRVIGKNNQLPWHLPADLKRFKAITSGHPIIMGRKTYESIGRPLPNRTNIIITRDGHFLAPGCIVTNSLPAAIETAASTDHEICFIIGGAEIYQQAIPHVQRLYLTIVHEHIEGDASFPALNAAEWRETNREDHAADNEHNHPFSFLVLDKIPH